MAITLQLLKIVQNEVDIRSLRYILYKKGSIWGKIKV